MSFRARVPACVARCEVIEFLSMMPLMRHLIRLLLLNTGGDWLDIEDCHGVFDGLENCSGCQNADTPCPRSASRNVVSENKLEDTTFDVLIIGSGCIGASIARELSKTSLKILWVEAADDVSQGATKGNSGIVHAGYDDTP